MEKICEGILLLVPLGLVGDGLSNGAGVVIVDVVGVGNAAK